MRLRPTLLTYLAPMLILVGAGCGQSSGTGNPLGGKMGGEAAGGPNGASVDAGGFEGSLPADLNRFLVRPMSPVIGEFTRPSDLGRRWDRMQGQITGSQLVPCVLGAKQISLFAPRARYRIEFRERGRSIVVLVSATVIRGERSLTDVSLTRQALKWMRKGLFNKYCGEGFVSKLAFGSRMEKFVVLDRSRLTRPLPVASLPGSIEFGDSTQDVARFEHTLASIVDGVLGGLKRFDEVTLNDDRVLGTAPGIHWMADPSTSPELFERYVSAYENTGTYAGEVQQYYWKSDYPVPTSEELLQLGLDPQWNSPQLTELR